MTPLGRIDSTTSPSLEEVIVKLLDGGERRLVLDLAGVDYMSSAGVRVLLVAARRLAENNGLVLCSVREPVRQVLELSGLLPMFAIEPSSDPAVARLVPRSG